MQDRKIILLVEDEVLIAEYEKRILIKFGYEVIISKSGEDAVEQIKKNNHIDLVLMDINLKTGIDGTEAAKQILKIRHIPIIFLTSHTEKEYVERVRKITRYGYIIKDSGDFVLKTSIEMAFELFESNRKLLEAKNKIEESEEKFKIVYKL